MELVGGEGEQIQILFPYMDGKMARGLHRVGVEGDPLGPADRADLPDGLDGADLVVGVHDRYKTGVLPDGLLHLMGEDDAVFVYIQKGDLKALPLQLLQGVQDSVMLECGGYDMLPALLPPQPCGGEDRLVVRLAAA